ncbi:MAG: M14 family zinc carboxypeptidase, partial [Anaerolineales bacterium]|nr:M14 family zinc carboxypeptidase [Anaerolineales bacterium]
PAELNLRFAEYLLHSYNLDPDVTWLLDHHEFHLLLQANPDGRKKAEQGLLWRKNTNTNYCSVYPMSRGADLNRNFSFQWGNWGGSSTDPCAETYRGNAAASEPETQAHQAYLSTLYPDLRADSLSTPAPLTTTGVFVDLHSYSNLVLWPWGFHDSPPPNGAALQTLGRKLAFFNAYAPRQAYDLYRTDGTSDDYAYGELGLPAFTIEMGSAFFENCQTFEQTILPDNLEMLVYAGKAARAPYLLPSGPEAVDPQLTPAVVEVGQAVTLTITLDDTRFNQSNGSEPTQAISIAQFTIGVPPWSDAAPSVAAPLIPVDGAFDTTSEDAWALIDTSSAPLGRSLVYVHAQDAAGNWGPVSAAFLTVLPPLKVYLPLVSH